jgi:hypothetical protein
MIWICPPLFSAEASVGGLIKIINIFESFLGRVQKPALFLSKNQVVPMRQRDTKLFFPSLDISDRVSSPTIEDGGGMHYSKLTQERRIK